MSDQSETVRKAPDGSTNLPVFCGLATGPQASAPRRMRSDTGFAAQMLGAAGQRRGLKGGAPVLQAARRAYLEAEWSGAGDRRMGRGALALTRI